MSSPGSSEMSRQSSIASSQSVITQLTSPEPSNDLRAKDIGLTTAFGAWRPSYHFIAPTGWMNDPCAPGYDPKTGLYHVSFQWNPKSADWGDICWGSATSPDLITWTFSEQPSLSPDTLYDGKGVFTGCMIHGQDGSLNFAYTSVSALPVHHTLAHPKGSESLSLATSHDSGKTWTKLASNPVLPSEPERLDVTGWRDPFVSKWPKIADILDLDAKNTLFGIISGGIRDVTPTSFLYAIDAQDLTRWRYVGPLASYGLNFRPSRWSGDLGRNWEVTNFCSLRDQNDTSVSRDFLIMGTEGCLPEYSETKRTTAGPSRPCRGQLWMSGTPNASQVGPTSGPVTIKYDFGGHLDHGCLYAANSFFDPATQKHIVWGWITEEDLCDDFRHRQGWSGLLALPREIRLQTINSVIGAWKSELSEITSIEREWDVQGSCTVRTLASQPVQSVIDGLRKRAAIRRARLGRQLAGSDGRDLALTSDDIRSTQWELDCSFRVSRRCQKIGFSLVHSRDFSSATTFSFSPQTETCTIDRPSFKTANSSELINTAPEKAPHTLFIMRDPENGDESAEPLHVRVWRDNSVLEVFINDRTVISTRIYAAENTIGLRFFADDAPAGPDMMGVGSSELLYATLWDGISSA